MAILWYEGDTLIVNQGVVVGIETTQDRIGALRQDIAARRARSASLMDSFNATPAREIPEVATSVNRSNAFSFVNSIHNDNVGLGAGHKEKLEAIMKSLSEKKMAAAAHTPEPLTTGNLAPTPQGLPNQPGPRVKTNVL